MSETGKQDAGAKAEEIGAGARVLKEVIKTPAFREILNLYLEDSNPKAARDLVKTLMEQDANLALSLVASSPGLINALSEVLLEIARQLKRFPPELLDSYTGQVLSGIDSEKLKEIPRAWGPILIKALPELIKAKSHALSAMADSLLTLEPKDRLELIHTACQGVDGIAIAEANNAFSKVVQTLAKEHFDPAEELKPALGDVFAKTDFGKMREAINILATYETDIFIASMEHIFANPIVIANLVGILAPMVNNGLRITSYALENIGMPGELIASSLFNTLGDINTKDLGRTLTAGSKMINDLHAGNYILGNEEPRFRAVFVEIASGTLENTDTDQIFGAVVALAEDMEVVFGVLTDMLIQNPDLLANIVTSKAKLINIFAKSGSNYFSALGQLPKEKLAEYGQLMTEGIDKKEIARLVNSIFEFQGKFMEANPDFCLLDGVVEEIDLDMLTDRLSQSSAKVSAAILEAPNVKNSLAAENVGKKINDLLVGFNKRAKERGPSDESYLKQVAAQIDSAELETAVSNALGMVRGVLFATSRRGMAILRPVISTGWHMVRFVFGSFTRKLLGSKSGGE